jgi:ATP-binding cassette subfamily C (CFTR/MRP) protein 4
LDEATANVDQATDNLLQQTLRERFKTATIIAIAHRLESVIGFDKVLVLGNGKLLEYGTPHDLLQNPDGHFSAMVNSTGQVMAAALKKNAKHPLERG